MNDHEFHRVREGFRGERDDRSPTNCSFSVGRSVYIVGNNGLTQGINLKVPFSKRRRSMKFPVAPESMRAVVSTVCLIPCREIGRRRVLFSHDAMSTWFDAREEDVMAAPLFKNPVLFVLWEGKQILQLVLQVVLRNTS